MCMILQRHNSYLPVIIPAEKLPVEAKLPWYKQAQELEEGAIVSEEPT